MVADPSKDCPDDLWYVLVSAQGQQGTAPCTGDTHIMMVLCIAQNAVFMSTRGYT